MSANLGASFSTLEGRFCANLVSTESDLHIREDTVENRSGRRDSRHCVNLRRLRNNSAGSGLLSATPRADRLVGRQVLADLRPSICCKALSISCIKALGRSRRSGISDEDRVAS